MIRDYAEICLDDFCLSKLSLSITTYKRKLIGVNLIGKIPWCTGMVVL